MRSCRQTWLKALALSLAVVVVANPVRAVEADAMTPAQAEFVLSVNLKQILDSGLYKKHAADLLNLALQSPEVKKIIGATGIDPMRDLDTVTVASWGIQTPKFLVMIRGKFDQNKIVAAIKAQAKEDPKVKISQEGAFTIVEAPAEKGQTVYTTVAHRGAVVMANDKETLLKAARSTGPARVNPELKSALGKLNGKESLWMAGAVTEELRKMATDKEAREFAQKVKGLTASLTLSDNADLKVQVLTNDADTAKTLKDKVDEVKPALLLFAGGNSQFGDILKELVDGLKSRTDNNTVTFDLTITEELIKKISKKDKN